MGTPITDPDIAALDRAGALTWRGTETEPLGDWLLRAGAGFTGRANSALTTGDPRVPLPEAAARIRRWYTTRGLPPMASVSYPAGQPERNPVDRFLADQGWTLRDEATVIVMTRTSTAATPAVTLPPPSGPARRPARPRLAGALPLPRPARAAAGCPDDADLGPLAGVRVRPGR